MPKHFVKCRAVPKNFITTLVTVSLLLLVVYPCWAQSTSQEVTTKRVLKATSIVIPPFLMVSEKGNQLTMKGFIVDLLEEIEKIVNVSFEIVLVKDGKWGGQTDLGNWTGMIGEVKSGYADVAAAPLTLSSRRLLHVDMSHPFITYGLKIVIKKPMLTERWNGVFLVLKPFTSVVWVLIVFAYVVTGVALGVIGRFSPIEWTNTSVVQVDREKRESFNWPNSFWYILTTFMRQGYRHYPRSYSGRIVSICWWAFALLTLVLYFGCMTAQLQSNTTQMIGLPFLTFAEMVHQKEVAYGTLKSSSTFKYFQNSHQITEHLIYKNMIRSEDNMASSIAEGLEKVRFSNGRYAFIMEGALAEYEVSRYPCDLMVVGDDIYKHSYSIVTEKSSPLLSEMNYAILKLQERGVIDMIHSKWQLGECSKGFDKETFIDGQTYYDNMKGVDVILGSHVIAGPLIILLVGILVAGIVLIAEVFAAKKEAKRGSSSTEDGHRLHDSFEDGN